VSLEVKNPLGKRIFIDNPKTNSKGVFTSAFRLSADAPLGTYIVTATYGDLKVSTIFQVTLLFPLEVTSLRLFDPNGNLIDKPVIGSSVLISADITNIASEDQQMIYIVQVKDSELRVVYLQANLTLSV